MIYCPECGTANRDGSKFCNECGHTLLAQTGVKCPHCDTLNAVQSVFCSHCGGRLLAQPSPAPSAITPAIKGLSLPTKPTVGEGEEIEQPPADSLEAPLSLASRPVGAGEAMGEESEELPAWLRDLQASLPIEPEAPEEDLTFRPPQPTVEAEAPAGPTIEAELAEEELPSWLAELKPTVEAEAPAGPTIEPELVEEELPGWLAELKPVVEAEAPAVSPVEPELAEEELPGWLAELKPAAEAETSAGPTIEPELVEEELPGWLAELKPAAEAELAEKPAEISPAATARDEELPAWLAESEPSAPIEVQLPAAEAELEEGELPAWLANLRGSGQPLPAVSGADRTADQAATAGPAAGVRRDQMPPEASEPLPIPPVVEQAPTSQGMPSWLSDIAADQAPFEPALAEGELPDWLVPAPGPGIPSEEETLARAEIPDWLLALKPRELKTEGEAAGAEPIVEEAVEQTGVLAGIRDVLPVEMLIAQPRAATPAEAMGAPFTGEAALVQASRVRLFDEIVTRSPVAAPKVLAKPGSRLTELVPWWIVYALLIVAVTAPLLLSEPLFDRNIEPAPSAQALHETIESLPANAQVLVAVDYDPTTSGEMDVVARSVIGHLMDRQARIVTVSLLPAGPATAWNLVEETAASYPGYQARDSQWCVNLGYLPGQAAAVRLLSQSLPEALPHDFEGRQVADLAALSGITSTQSFDLIVELAASSDTLRWWIEQAGAPYGVSLAAVVSAAVEPMARTYYETEPQQLKGVIGGVPGAAGYESLRSGGAGPSPEMAARLDSLLVGQLLIILVILGGNLIRPNRVARHSVGRDQ